MNESIYEKDIFKEKLMEIIFLRPTNTILLNFMRSQSLGYKKYLLFYKDKFLEKLNLLKIYFEF